MATGSRYDYFASYNSQEKGEVTKICRKLDRHDLRSWLDDEQIQPGLPWQDALEQQITEIGAALVFVGKSNIGPWQRAEMRGFIEEFIKRQCPVIPVLLPSATRIPGLPVFLRALRWVDLRTNPRRGLLMLVWGITGERPVELD